MSENLPAEMSLPAVVAEIDSLRSMMADQGSAYWRNETVRSRYRDLLDARDGGGQPEIVDPGEDAFVAAEMTPVRQAQHASAAPGSDYGSYLRAVRHVSDVVFQVPAGERESLIRAFNALPDQVTGAMSAELLNSTGTGFAYCDEAEVRTFARENGGRVVREWGNDAQVKMARVRGRLNRCMASLDDAGFNRFLDWHENLTDAQAAAVYRKLAE